MALTLPVKAAIQLVGGSTGFLTDHSRSELDLSYEEIGSSKRTVAGTYRGYVIARKRKLDVSWDLVPSEATLTVDGYWGGSEMLSFYTNNTGSFTVRVFDRDKARKSYQDTNPELSITMVFEDFSYTIAKRNVALTPTTTADLWNVSMSLVEV
jgi:hypothetical protein